MSLPFEIWASPEATYARTSDRERRDELEETGFARRLDDVDRIASLGVAATRFPILWEKAERADGTLDLAWARPRMERLRALGVAPVVTLLHHGSGPLAGGLLDPHFASRFVRYAREVARAFPWVERWTPINEPLTTARFSTLYGHWFPNARDDAVFAKAMLHQARAMQDGMRAIRASNPRACFVLTEDLQGFETREPSLAAYVAHKRERAFLSFDLVAGRVDADHPLRAYLARAGASDRDLDALAAEPVVPDLLGWNYYPNSERDLSLGPRGETRNVEAVIARAIDPRPLLRAAYARTRVPFGLAEVHRAGDDAQRVAWLRARRDDLLALHAEGLPVRMLGAWAAFGLIDWRSLLRRRENATEDGVFTFAGRDGVPRETAVARELRAMCARALAARA